MSVSHYYDVRRDASGGCYLEPYTDGFSLVGLPL